MNNKVPEGLSAVQWNAIMDGLSDHPSTMNDYRKIINLLHSFDNGRYHITSITKEEAIDYFAMLDQKAAEGKMSKNTVHRYQATLRSIGTRIEQHPDTFPGYTNPFSGIMHNEVRSRTVFTKDMFADPRDIEKIIHIIPKLPQDKQILLELMLFLGLRPKQVENLTDKNFTRNPLSPDKEIVLMVEDGTYVEKSHTHRPLKETEYRKLDSTSANGNRTWCISTVYRFFSPYSAKLKQVHPDICEASTGTPLFLTSHKQAYSYRALHHLLQEVCTKAGLDPNAVTPYQLTLYGVLSSYLLYDVLAEETELKKKLPHTKSREEHNTILREIHAANDRFLPLAKFGWIGTFVAEYPLNRVTMVNEIKECLGKKFLYEAIHAQ